MNRFTRVAAICASVTLCAATHFAAAHGFAGDRFFPPTITTDDPFAADELALPTVSYFRNGGAPGNREVDGGFEFDKLIVPHLSLGVSDTYSWFHPVPSAAGPITRGFSNLELNAKYELVVDPAHEFILSAGIKADLGGTGSRDIDRDSFTTFIPTLYFGKGFGELPDSVRFLKPLALTGTIGEELPTRAKASNSLDWGLSLQYQIPYLQQHVQDVGIPAPFKNMIPLLEFAGNTIENRGPSITTGTINPGVLYETKYFQIGVEALLPMNHDSGDHIGAVFQIWFFLDDLAPHCFGTPLFFGE